VEKLDEGNEWYCPKCKQHKLAAKQMYIYKTPKVLIIHLKRFKQKADKWFASKAKMGCLVKFPHELDVEKFVISKTLPEAYFHKSANTDPLVKPPKSFSADACTHYELFAVSNHYGSMGGGHYTAYAKNDGSWYHYNDSNVSKISPS
jgi:ubiquitin carboxyl-terminal hydrolase 4/11/15